MYTGAPPRDVRIGEILGKVIETKRTYKDSNGQTNRKSDGAAEESEHKGPQREVGDTQRWRKGGFQG